MALFAWDKKRTEKAIVRLALRDLRWYISEIATDDPAAIAAAIRDFYPDIVAKYGATSAALAAEQFEAATGLPAMMIRPIDPGRTQDDLSWALAPLFRGSGDLVGRLESLIDMLVKQPGRATTYASTRSHQMRYARVPWGDTCAFCLMLASRGDVYHTEATAGGDEFHGTKDDRYHGFCDCSIEPIATDDDMEILRQEAGYDPDELFDKYLAARGAADSGDPSDILSALREREGIN